MLKIAVASVLSQGDFVRLHVLDNASNDGTQEWLSALAASDSRVQLTLRKENLGGLANFCEGFEKIDTPYALPLASDDELLPNFLKASLEIAERHFRISGVVFQTQVKKNGEVLYLNPLKNTEGIINPCEHLAKWCAGGHYFSWSSILWDTQLLNAINAKDEFQKHGFFGDAWIQFLAFSQRDFYLVDCPGAILNIHDDQLSQQFSSKFVEDVASIFGAVKNDLNKRNDLNQTKAKQLANLLFENWNNMILGKCWHHGPNLSNHAKCEILQKYVECFSSEELFDSFAPLPLFNKFTSLVKHSEFIDNKINDIEKKYKDSLQEKLKLEKQIQCMRGSYSWRITYPFRKIFQLLNSN